VSSDAVGPVDDDAKSRGGWELLTRTSSNAQDNEDEDGEDGNNNDDEYDDELVWGDKSFVDDEDDDEYDDAVKGVVTGAGLTESQFAGTEEEREALSDMLNFQRAGLGVEPYTMLSTGLDADATDNAPAADTLFGLVSDSDNIISSTQNVYGSQSGHQEAGLITKSAPSGSSDTQLPAVAFDAASVDGRATLSAATMRGVDDVGTEVSLAGGVSSPTVRTSIAAQDRKKYCGQGIIRFTSEPHSVLAVQRAYALRLSTVNAASTATTSADVTAASTIPQTSNASSSSPPPKVNKLSKSERHKARKVRLPPTELRIETLRYRDFDTSEPMLITHDFSWEEHGFDLVARFFPAAAPVLDKQFKIAFDLTYNVFSGTGEYVNTEPFRTAIKMYVLRLFGVRNDHYDYAMVNKFMTIATKTFVKKVVCAPETVTANDFANFSFLFSDDEKVHIILLASEARRQAALLWGLNAVTRVFRGT
jgi:hypothetical protein